MGFENFAAPITSVNCTDHNGHHSAYMQQWDGTKWVKISDWIAPMKDKVRPLLEAAAKDYVVQEPALAGPRRGLRKVVVTRSRFTLSPCGSGWRERGECRVRGQLTPHPFFLRIAP